MRRPESGAAMLDVHVDPDVLWRHAEAIAQWSRETASAGEALAFDYLATELTNIGAEVHRTSVPAYVSLPGRAELSIDGRALPVITHAMTSSTPPEGIDGELVAARVTAPEGWEGRLVVFDGLATAGSVRRAQEAGAIAALFLSEDEFAHEMIVSSVWGSPEPDELTLLPRIPAASLAREPGEALREMLAATAHGAPPRGRLIAEVDTGWREIPQLIADVRAPRAREERFVLFSGHVDSWHRGAMDNGGANAVMLEVARVAQASREHLQRHLRIAFWSGHSHGRYAGSAAYVDRHWEELDRDCVVHVNIDSVGGRGATVLTRAPSMACTHQVGAEAIAAVAGQTLERERLPRAGDQSLANLGVPALFLTLSEQPAGGPERLRDGSALVKSADSPPTGGLGWWWHTPQDTLDKLDRAALTRDAEIYRRAVLAFAADPVLPIDVAAAAAELDEQLRALAAHCEGRFELAPLLEQSGRVLDLARAAIVAAERAREHHRDEAPDEDRSRDRLDEALTAAVRPLVRIGHAVRDRFAHDAPAQSPYVPLLAPLEQLLASAPGSDEEHALRVLLLRRRNRLSAELRRSLDALSELTRDAHGGR